MIDHEQLEEERARLLEEAREHVAQGKAALRARRKLQDEMDAYAVDNQIYAGMTIQVALRHHGDHTLAETIGATDVPEGADWPRYTTEDYTAPQALARIRAELWRWLDAGAVIVVVPRKSRKKKGKR